MKTFISLLSLVSVAVFFGCTNELIKSAILEALPLGRTDESVEPVIVEVEADMIELHTWHFTSGVPNNVILVKHPNENAVFECKVINGRLYLMGPDYEKNLSVKPGDKFRWVEFNESGPLATHDFVEIIIKIEENLIGYAVIEINRVDPLTYNAVVLKSVLFPQIDGEYQHISEEYVKTAIEKIEDEILKDRPNVQMFLSDMTEAECLEFIIQNGIEIPDGFPEVGAFVKRTIQAAESNPNVPSAYSYDVTYNFAESIRALVNEYYGTAGKPEEPAEPAMVEVEEELIELHRWISTPGLFTDPAILILT
jgi:hypothetical protein